MRIFAVDTSSELTSLALVDSGVVIGQAEHHNARGHVEAIGALFKQIPQIDVTEPDFVLPDLIVCGVGPGPFTGLRVGIAFAQSLSAAWGIPISGICSLDAVARAARDARPGLGECVVALDARRGEYYWARYSSEGMRVGAPQVSTKEDVLAMSGEVVVDVLPHATDLAQCVGSSEILGLTPLYLRAPDAQPQTQAGTPT